MRTLISTELLKLRTVRWPWALLAAQVGLVVLGVTGFAIVAGNRPFDPQGALAHVGLTSILSLVLGIMAVAGEYRDRTITDTFLATPLRSRVVGAKLVVYTAAGLVFAVITALVGVATAAAWLAARGSSLDIGADPVWQTLAGAIAWDTAFAAIGVGLGALVPNLAGAVTLGLAWIALVETLLGQLVGRDVARWFPVSAGEAAESIPNMGLLVPWAGGLVLLAYVLLFATVGIAATVRRDVT